MIISGIVIFTSKIGCFILTPSMHVLVSLKGKHANMQTSGNIGKSAKNPSWIFYFNLTACSCVSIQHVSTFPLQGFSLSFFWIHILVSIPTWLFQFISSTYYLNEFFFNFLLLHFLTSLFLSFSLFLLFLLSFSFPFFIFISFSPTQGMRANWVNCNCDEPKWWHNKLRHFFHSPFLCDANINIGWFLQSQLYFNSS